MEHEKVEVCSIRIMFPVTSDDEAIEYKKKIAEVVKDMKESSMQFTIMSGRPPTPSV